jgi:pyruvate ferredoxin oxidoreductase alpha subunit
MFKMLDGNSAAVEAMKLAKVKVIAAYPITPQSPISEQLSDLVADSVLNAQYIRVESEHSAMSATVAAQMTGVRAATATASNGLALMHEVLSMASGNRQPIVMPVVNRAVAAPWSLWCEHGDAMSQRDLGWLQIYCENGQEILDFMMLAYRVAEDSRVLLPIMVCLDGFFLSHSMQKIDVPSQADADAYIGEYVPKNLKLDPADPMFVCDLTTSDEYPEMKFQQSVSMHDALDVINEAADRFEKKFGRKLSIAEGYMTDDADVVLVAIGSMCGTAKCVVDALREKGEKVGLLKLSVFRPFPSELIKEYLYGKKVIGVFDRSSGLGNEGGPLWNEIRGALLGSDAEILSFIGGLGGRDVSPATLERIYFQMQDVKVGNQETYTQWIDVRDDAMRIREVQHVQNRA